MVTNIGTTKVLHVEDVGAPDPTDEPTLQWIPSVAVTPVHVPGAPSDHLGYFVYLDAYNHPIHTRTNSQADSMPTLDDRFITTMDAFLDIAKGGISNGKKNALVNGLFELTLQSVLQNGMKSIGIDDIELPKSSGIYSCIFERVLQKEDVKVVFVPTSHMAYFAYDYRGDGTGKALMEDSEYFISMRTSLLVANVMGAIDQATDKRKITFDMDSKKGSQVEQTMHMIKEAYMTKNAFNFGHDPKTITKDIISRNVAIVPKNMRDVHNMDMEIDVQQGQSSQPDSELIEKLTNLTIAPTNVPPSFFNEMGENEFSRALATMNVVFCNFIRTKQNKTTDIAAPMMGCIARNSYFLMFNITKILKDNMEAIQGKKDGTGPEEDAETMGLDRYMNYVLSNINVGVPTPNIAPDTSRFEELDKILNSIDDVVTKLMPEEMITGDSDMDEHAKEAMLALRADAIRRATKDALVRIGASGAMNLDILDTLDVESVHKFSQEIRNYAALLKQQSEVLDPEKQEGEDDDDEY